MFFRVMGMRAVVLLLLVAPVLTKSAALSAQSTRPPSYTVDPFWPKPLPNHWIVGAVAGVVVDSRDHVWIIQRPSTLQPNETRSIWRGAPPVIEFDPLGNVVQAWGGPGA